MLFPRLLTPLLSLSSQFRSPRTNTTINNNNNNNDDPIATPTVLIDGTKVTGYYQTDDSRGQGYYTFPNIRYALAPIGPLRFSKPVPPPWNSSTSLIQKKPIFSSTTGAAAAEAGEDKHIPRRINNNPICPQAYPGWMCRKHSTTYDREGNADTSNWAMRWCRYAEEQIMADVLQEEDCLFLDVFVPRGVFENGTSGRCVGRALAPVVVSFGTTPFIYGSKNGVGVGGPSPAILTQHSTNPDNTDASCATQYPVVVSINYRLGLFGWFNDRNSTQNLGLWDQRLALEWVRQHAQIFGGDPDRITLVGIGSGGGGSIMHQLTAFGGKPNTSNRPWYYKNNTTPFQQAILMSPTWNFTPDREGTFKKVMETASEIAGRSISTVDHLKQLSSETLMQINRQVVRDAPLNHDVFGPVTGGEFTPAHPAVLLRDGRFDPNIKIIIGKGQYHHIRTGPISSTPTKIHTQMYNLLHGFTKPQQNHIINKLYDPKIVNPEFNKWYENKLDTGPKKLSNKIYPLSIRAELYTMDEILVGCNRRHVAHFFGLINKNKNNTGIYAYDSLDAEPTAMMGLFNGKERTYRERFLRFIGTGDPNVAGSGSDIWQPYGSGNLVLEHNPAGSLPEVMTRDVHQNNRCEWWVERGYELIHQGV